MRWKTGLVLPSNQHRPGSQQIVLTTPINHTYGWPRAFCSCLYTTTHAILIYNIISMQIGKIQIQRVGYMLYRALLHTVSYLLSSVSGIEYHLELLLHIEYSWFVFQYIYDQELAQHVLPHGILPCTKESATHVEITTRYTAIRVHSTVRITLKKGMANDNCAPLSAWDTR